MLILRPAAERGHANHGWLDSWHSFSFGSYQDPAHMHFGPLRVINEDRVQPGGGFAPHSHQDMEIISYVLAGELAHQDSLGNGSVIRPGDVQRMSAGRGVQHSEYNASRAIGVHFLQIWIIPDVTGIAPEYEQAQVPDTQKRGRLSLIASPDGAEKSLRIHQDARIHAGRFDGSELALLPLAPGRLGYVHVVSGRLVVNGQAMAAGDGARLDGEAALAFADGIQAEVLAFDLPPD
jgi:redox-sensitive bicupin YhaK (pirin superfamily)